MLRRVAWITIGLLLLTSALPVLAGSFSDTAGHWAEHCLAASHAYAHIMARVPLGRRDGFMRSSIHMLEGYDCPRLERVSTGIQATDMEEILVYECIAFDVDGTLVDTNKSIIVSLQKALLEELGRNYTEDELRFILGIPGSVALEHLGVPDIQAASKKWIAYVRENSHLVSVFPGIEDLLAGLRTAGVVLALVTSRTRAELDRDLSRFGLLKSFPLVVCADDTERGKPHPDPLLKLLADTGLKSTDVLYVGDTLYDSQCAQAAGVKFALALWGAANPDVPCDYRLEHPEELMHLCRQAP